jgi:hypothetical protein
LTFSISLGAKQRLRCSSVDQGIDFAGGVAMKQNAAFNTLAEKQIGRLWEQFLFFAVAFDE